MVVLILLCFIRCNGTEMTIKVDSAQCKMDPASKKQQWLSNK